jgi:hypothetical protein
MKNLRHCRSPVRSRPRGKIQSTGSECEGPSS